MSGEKTELPTNKRLRDARKKGQVAHSKEVSSTALLIAMFTYFYVGGDWIYQNLIAMIGVPSQHYGLEFGDALSGTLVGVFTHAVLLCLPAIGLVLAVGVGANYAQVGALFSVEPLTPKFSKLNPAEKLKQTFSTKNLIEFAKSCFKVLFLGILIYLLIKKAIGGLVFLPYDGLPGVLSALHTMLFRLAILTSFAYAVIAVADFVLQKKQHTKQLMMSKQEVKQEHKENEGDPTIKGRRRQLHRELANDESVKRVKKSSVLVTNPTHFAVALYYEKGVTKLPIILAKGSGSLALRMIDEAKHNDIPVMRNVPLARGLFAFGNVDSFIPRDFIRPVAEVLRVVMRIAKEKQFESLE
ncbi:type III secretion system export apparatus subunit SctU [Roseiconus lacunae]|uniref:type III secretion system export apparatus subunit SctU n=1 Tax=Roseiconus lacunae TaxID=2605694 RepID=UPI001E56AC84|nr:type III secretion system export apparatus subunit SctU [Roseiconus lacunae]MCD0457852.1 type III secretion system export apparatus subunit SctU [Roseiconus lacunae]